MKGVLSFVAVGSRIGTFHCIKWTGFVINILGIMTRVVLSFVVRCVKTTTMQKLAHCFWDPPALL